MVGSPFITVLLCLVLQCVLAFYTPTHVYVKPIAFRPSTVTKTWLQSDGDDDAVEKCWRFVKKPLLRIGSKGATSSHGNSLRQLLEDHMAVKVKVNTKTDGSLEKAFETLRDLAVENGAPKDIELIQYRDGDKMILFGSPGTLQKIKEGTFPPSKEEE